jgi:hypothetical protein
VFFDEATQFIKQSKASGKPFLCYIPTNIPHGPFFAAKKYVEIFKDKPHPALFGALVHFDERVGEMRAMLQESGLAENTIFIYCTDNGAPKSQNTIFNARMRGGKGSVYDGGHRVPFLIHWPAGKLTGGRDVNQLSAHLDVLPTLIDLCQLQTIPENYQTDGVTLKPVLEETVDDLDDRVLVSSLRSVVMTKRWRLAGKGKNTGTELYDMSTDPAQTNNVAKAHPEIVSRLKAAYEKVSAKDDIRQQRVVIGSDKQNPTEFTPDQWDEKIVGFWQRRISKGLPGTAPILAEVEVPGSYRFSLRRWPEESNQPIRSAPELTVPDGFEGKTKTEKERALPIVKARLKVADFDRTIDVTDDMTEATFTAPLKKGDCDILAEFIGSNGKTYGAYFLSVEREDVTDTTRANEAAKKSSAGSPVFAQWTPPDKGWVSLFNGKDLTGWQTPKGEHTWQVIDYEAKGGNLVTKKTFKNYKLHIEWRIKRTEGDEYTTTLVDGDGVPIKDKNGRPQRKTFPNADSGVFLRGGGMSQLNILCWPCGSGQMWRFKNHENPEVRKGAWPDKNADKPVGEWNAFDIELIGEAVTVVLNGETIAVTRMPGIRKSGPIALQHHGGYDEKTKKWNSMSALVQFRNIWIKELPTVK